MKSEKSQIEYARDAIREYNEAYARGEEQAYPHWADDVLQQSVTYEVKRINA